MDAARAPELLGSTAGPEPLRIAFVITGLDRGGAEVMLWKLLSRIDRSRFAPTVIVLRGDAIAMLDEFRRIPVQCHVLDWHPGGLPLGGLRQLVGVLRSQRPHLVQGWMYHANIAATLATACARLSAPVLWNVRQSLLDLENEKTLTRLLIRAGGKLSFSAAAIVNNSEASALEHEMLMGYRATKRAIVPNGFDGARFRPSRASRAGFRASIGVDDDAVLVGLVARYHPVKGHATFLAAAGKVAKVRPEARFVMVGDAVDASNATLAMLIADHGIRDRVHLMGGRGDVHAIMPALDIFVSSSVAEGFPNVVGEAMSCAVPCVVTDVGDSARIVGDTGITVPARDSDALAAGMLQLIDMGVSGRAELGERARQRALSTFSLDAVVRQYEDLYTRVYQQRRSG